MPLNKKNIILTASPREKKWITRCEDHTRDHTPLRPIIHQKHLAQSGYNNQSAVDIFNTLHVFTKEPIKEQEIK